MHVAIDDHSRVAYVEMLPADDAANAAVFVRQSQRWFAQQPIKRVLTDNGAGYISREFGGTCDQLIRRKRTRSRRPQTNGKAERLIQTCFGNASIASPTTAPSSVVRRLIVTSTSTIITGHSSLNDNAPISRLVGNNVLTRNI